ATTTLLPPLYLSLILPPPRSTLFPYTTLFRSQIANAPVLLKFLPLSHSLLRANNTKAITTTIAKIFGTSGYISIDKQLKPVLVRSEEHTSELQSRFDLVCRLLLEKKKKYNNNI